MSADSPWLMPDEAADYISGGVRTETGKRKYSERFLAKQVRDGKLRAARIGGRGRYVYRKEWLDTFIEERATPVVVSPRRFAR